MRFTRLAFVTATCVAFPVARARADATSEYENNMAFAKAIVELRYAMKAGDMTKAVAAIQKVPDLYKRCTRGKEPGSGSKELSDLADLVKQTKFLQVRSEALKALVDCGDGESAWKA